MRLLLREKLVPKGEISNFSPGPSKSLPSKGMHSVTNIQTHLVHMKFLLGPKITFSLSKKEPWTPTESKECKAKCIVHHIIFQMKYRTTESYNTVLRISKSMEWS